MDMTDIRLALRDRNLLAMSKQAGVSYSALRKIAAGKENVSLRTYNRVVSYLFGKNQNGKTN